MVRVGRPAKYDDIIAALDASRVYSAATIARFALGRALFSEDEEIEPARAHQRLRITLGRMTQNKRNLFPPDGDAKVKQPGQPATAGWFGWRWQRAYDIPTPKLA